MTIQVGQIITDGTATFIVDDVRDGHRVGNIILDHILRQGYIKANGAVLQAADYPRLVQFVTDNNLSVTEAEWQAGKSGLYVYDETAGTLRVPDLRGIFLRGLDDGRGIDTGRVLGTIQADMLKSHVHYIGSTSYHTVSAGYNNVPVWDGSSNSGATGGTETRPKNVVLIVQIKC